MNLPSLLSELEPLTHAARFRRMVTLGRDAARGDETAHALTRGLAESTSVYQRLLATMSLHGSRDGARIVALVTDPSRAIRKRAITLVALYVSDDEARATLDRAVGKYTVCGIAAKLSRRRRYAPLEGFLGARLAAEIDPALVDILPLTSNAFVAKHQSLIEEHGSAVCWARLASKHPSLYVAWLGAVLDANRPIDPRTRWRIVPGLPTLATSAPDAARDLIRRLSLSNEDSYPFRIALRVLLARRPRETFDVIRERHERALPSHPPGAFGVAQYDKVARRLGAERLEVLLHAAPRCLSEGKQGVTWFLSLPTADRDPVLRAFLARASRTGWGAFLFRFVPAGSDAEKAAREDAFEGWSRAARASDGTIAPAVLAWLPKDLREREASRHLRVCEPLASKPERRIEYARLLSFAAAKEDLASFLGHSEGDWRARAQAILIATVELEPSAIGAALDNVRARRFEQDPVRGAMMKALADLPIARFQGVDLEAVGVIVQHALDAADLSAVTASFVERLVARLTRMDGAWGVGWLARLLSTRGSVSTWGLGEDLTRAEAERLSPALAELASTWATRERAGAIITLAKSLGIRLEVVTPVLEALERLATHLPFAGVAAAALDLLSRHDRSRFARLVPELLAVDRSFSLVPSVAVHVSVHRQDLLPMLLTSSSSSSSSSEPPSPMSGRFASGRTHWVIHFVRGYDRWTEALQNRHAASLAGLAADVKRDVPTLRFVVNTLVELAFADPSHVTRLAADPRPPLREIAVRALPWLDAGAGVSVLLECLDDDRARWAIYALRKAFSERSREEVLASLRAAPTKKVTVAKEVTRLLGDLGGDEAYRELLAIDAPGAHRDVRIALLRALWDHLERPETWAVFERAVGDPDWVVGSKLADIPLDRLSTTAEARVVALLATILSRPEPEARVELLKRAAQLPLRDPLRTLFQRILLHMKTPAIDECVAAFAAVLARMLPSEVSSVVDALVALTADRRRLVALLPVLMSRLGPYASRPQLEVAQATLQALQSDARATPLWLSLAGSVLGSRELTDALVDLARRDQLHFDAMEVAMQIVRASPHVDLIEERLRGESDARLRRVALAALVHSAGPERGWTVARRAQLEVYRSDPAVAVSGPASFVLPP